MGVEKEEMSVTVRTTSLVRCVYAAVPLYRHVWKHERRFARSSVRLTNHSGLRTTNSDDGGLVSIQTERLEVPCYSKHWSFSKHWRPQIDRNIPSPYHDRTGHNRYLLQGPLNCLKFCELARSIKDLNIF